MKYLVGNDLIDLCEPEIKKKSKNERFIRRVLSDNEYIEIKKQKSPDIFLWSLWSAKESAYKILKKIIPDLVFSHSKFKVEKTDKDSGIVKYANYIIPVKWFYKKAWIHCIATYSENKVDPKCLEWDVVETSQIETNQCFTGEEEASIYSTESKAVRELAKETLSRNSLDDVEIIRFPQGVRFGPPEIWKDGGPLLDWDISMSHDGRFSSVIIAKA